MYWAVRGMTAKRAMSHIAQSVTANSPIDRQHLADLLGMGGDRLESWLLRAVCAFCMHSQGRTGAFENRGPKLRPVREKAVHDVARCMPGRGSRPEIL